MDVFVGWFKRAFVQSTGRLVAQLYAGLTFFDFNLVNTDSTVHTGYNNVYAAKDSDDTVYKKRAIRTAVWIEPVTGRAVCNHYEYGSINNTPSASPPLAIETTPIAPFITVNGVYVAHMNEGRTTGFFPGEPAPNARPSGGVHIQNIAGIDHIVGYQLFTYTDGFEIKKYKVILDMSIDQESIVRMPYDKSVIYTEDSNFKTGDELYHLDAENGSYELTVNVATASRSLVCNEDGSKTVFFAIRRSSGAVPWDEAEYYPIFELTDTETVFEVNEILQYENESSPSNNDVDTGICSGGWTVVNTHTRENCQNPGSDYTLSVADHSGTYNFTETHTNVGSLIKTSFLGCAYDRFNDQPIVIFRRSGNAPKERIVDYDITRGGSVTHDEGPGSNLSDLTVNRNFTVSIDWGVFGSITADNRINELIIQPVGGQEEVVCSGRDSATSASGTANSDATSFTEHNYDVSAVQSTSKFQVTDYQIIDLSTKLVVYKYIEEYVDITQEKHLTSLPNSNGYFDEDVVIDFTTGDPDNTYTRFEHTEKYYLYQNGTSLMIRDTQSTDNPSYYSSVNIQVTGTPTGGSVGDCGVESVPDCDNPTKVCTTTVTYTCP